MTTAGRHTDPPTRFDAPVEARAYGMAIAVAHALGGGWELVQPHLADAIAARPDAPYVECLLDAVERLAEPKLRQ